MNQTINNQTVYLLENLGCLRISGEDSIKFLQGQITINSENLSEGQLQLGTVCNVQGRSIALFWATLSGEDVLLFMLRETIETTLSHFNKYAVFFKTQLEDDSENLNLAGYFADASPPANQAIATLNYIQDSTSGIILITATDKKDFNLLTDNQSFTLSSASNDFLAELVKKGIPWLTQSSQSEFLPHSLNLPELNAVDFKKGCFTGQEVIARMQYKGKLKSHMQRFETSQQAEEILPGTKVFGEDKRAGEVICATNDSQGSCWILAVIKDARLESKNFRLKDENGPILELINDSQEKN